MKENIKIALMDTGINMGHPFLKDKIAGSYDVAVTKTDSKTFLNECSSNDINGHGTLCASAIIKECNNVDIYSFKVLNDLGIGNLQLLETALQCAFDMDVDIVNLSLSIIGKINITKFKELFKRFEKAEIVVIASVENHMEISYPAILNSCYGVRGCILDEKDAIWFNKHKKVQCIVDSTPYMHCDLKAGYTMFGKSNSYAAAKLSGVIASIMYRNNIRKKTQINLNLCKKASKTNWRSAELLTSRRYPVLDEFEGFIDQKFAHDVCKVVRKYLQPEAHTLCCNEYLFTRQVGLTYEKCYGLLNVLMKFFDIKIEDYTKISKEDFYTVYHLSKFIQEHKS